jgi:hypothetical protein
MGLPKATFTAAALSILTGLSLGMFGVLQSMIPVRNPNLVHIERELLAFSKVQNAFMRPTPIGTQIGFVFVVPDQPTTASKETRRWKFEIG